MVLTRRKWLGRSLFYGGGFGGLAYGGGVERRWLSVTRVDVPLDPRHAALDGLKVAAMSDFHHDDFGDEGLIRRAVGVANGEGVDLVMLAGDYISREPAAVDPLCAELASLRPRLGTFAVLGNHDRWHRAPHIIERLSEAGARVLVDEAAILPGFAVVGLDSYWGGTPLLPRTLSQVGPDLPILLGWHEPDTFDLLDDPRIALQISGHTHGGQIRAPLYGPILLPRHGRKYPYGLYRRGAASLFVTRGIGTLTLPARFLCPPELAILTLKVAA
jgi:predicted MPP superfamily phosphohydrolase